MVATLVVMVIGGGWVQSFEKPRLINPREPDSLMQIGSAYGWIGLAGPAHKNADPAYEELKHLRVGVWVQRYSFVENGKWIAQIRYRTLFILAMIPWLITLIRMIRIWKRKRVFETELRTE